MEDAQIDSYLEAQLVADIKMAKKNEHSTLTNPRSAKETCKSKTKPRMTTKTTDEYEFLEDTDDGLPLNYSRCVKISDVVI